MEQAAEDAGGGGLAVVLLFLLLRLRADGDGLRGGQELHIGPHRRHGLGQLRRAEAPQLLEFIHPQPHQQGVRRRDVQLLAALLPEGVPEVGEPGHEMLPLLRRPHVVRLEPQGRLELGEPARTAEVDPVELRQLVGGHEVVVGLYRRLVGPDGNHPDDVGGDGGRAVAFQHADPLVALLDVEPAQVLVAPNGVPDALVPQVGGAQLHPLGGELRVRVQQGHEVGGEGAAPPGGLGAGDLLGGDLQHPHVRPSGHHVLVQDLVQDRGVGVLAPDHPLLVVFLAKPQGFDVLFHGFLSAHRCLLLVRRLPAGR